MRIEVPECKRCCCCVPLRYGLLFWCYLKLIILILAVAIDVYDLCTGKNFDVSEIVARIFNMIDIIFTVMFVVSAHKKSPKLIRVYYYYCITSTSLLTLLVLGLIGLLVVMIATGQFGSYWIFGVVYSTHYIITMFVIIVIQAYLIILVRSEKMKLVRNEKSFTFVNYAAKAEVVCATVLNTDPQAKCAKELQEPNM